MPPFDLPEGIILKIGPVFYALQPWDSRDADARHRWGETDHRERIIRIDQSASHRQAAWTLLHEVTHCIDIVWGVQLGEKASDEWMVANLSAGLATFIVDNQVVMLWLINQLRPPAQKAVVVETDGKI